MLETDFTRAMDKQAVSNFYDLLWTQYLPDYKASEDHWRLFYSAHEIAGLRVLDAGCGTGIFSVIFARNGAGSVTGIDISPGSLTTAQSLKEKFALDNVIFEQQDMLKLPYPDATFDVVWAWGTVHHTTDPLKAINELVRVLKPRGSILLAIYRRTNLTWVHEAIRRTMVRTPRRTWTTLARAMAVVLWPAVALFKRRDKARKGERLDELVLDWYFVPVRHHYTPDEIRAFLENQGLHVEKFMPASGRFDSSSNFIFKARYGAPTQQEELVTQAGTSPES